jgi:hypothetical protein
MFWWLDLPAPLLWGAVMAVLAIIPVFGAALIWVPAAIVLALGGSWEKALVLTAWGGIVVALIDNLLYPMLIRKDLRMHTAPVFIAMVWHLLYRIDAHPMMSAGCLKAARRRRAYSPERSCIAPRTRQGPEGTKNRLTGAVAAFVGAFRRRSSLRNLCKSSRSDR